MLKRPLEDICCSPTDGCFLLYVRQHFDELLDTSHTVSLILLLMREVKA